MECHTPEPLASGKRAQLATFSIAQRPALWVCARFHCRISEQHRSSSAAGGNSSWSRIHSRENHGFPVATRNSRHPGLIPGGYQRLLDIQERGYWKQYTKAYEECLSATSTQDAPWYIVPADDKENARLIVSRVVLDTFEALKMTHPKASAKRRRELLSLRKRLAR